MIDEKKVAVPEVPVAQSVESLSHRQLRGQLKKIASKRYEGKGFVMGGVDFGDSKKKSGASLDVAFAVVLGTVLDNTRIGRVIDAKRTLRPDQIGPGKLNSYLV